MGGLFGGGSKTTTVERKPRVERMPVEKDPSIEAATSRTKKAALARKGRSSTILTDESLAGSSGEKLGD